MKKLVIIPTYNEKGNIVDIVTAVFALRREYHVLVIDDGSPDGTALLVKNMAAQWPARLFLLERNGKLGLGTAYITGFKWALENGYDMVFEMDADFSHDPNDLDRLMDACILYGADVAIGSRYVEGGKLENWPFVRKFYSKGGALFTKLVTWMPVNDPTAGFICYMANVLAAIDFDAIKFVGYAFQIEMKFACWKLGFKIKEVPITFKDRKIGTSKISRGIITEGVVGVVRIQFLSLFKKYRKKVAAGKTRPTGKVIKTDFK